jgi:hypothetical protein
MAGVAIFGLAAVSPAAAHQSPPGCAGNGLVAAIAGAGGVHRNGDVISLTPSYGNVGTNVCDITNATVRVRLPSPDGTTGQPVIVAQGLDIPAGTPLTALPAVRSAVHFDDGVFRGPAEIDVTATLHDSPADSGAAVSRTASVVISRPHVTLAVSPVPASGPAPLAVTSTYLASNDSPLDPGAGAVPPSVAGPRITDDRCGAAVFAGGDADGDALLDRGETWRYTCDTVLGVGAFAATATLTGTSALDGRPWPSATAAGAVTATAAPIAPGAVTATAAPIAIPADRTRPRLRLFAPSPARFRAARSGPAVATRRIRGGTRVTYSVSEASAVRFTVDRRRDGRRVGTRCVTHRRGNHTGRRCTHWDKLRGAFSVPGAVGRHTVRFSGRLRGKRLAPGRYRLAGVATDAAGNRSVIARKSFRIVR